MQNPPPPWGGDDPKSQLQTGDICHSKKTPERANIFVQVSFYYQRGDSMVDEKTVTTLGVGIFPKGALVQTASGFKGEVVDMVPETGRMAVLKAGTRGLYLFFNPGQLRPWFGD
jgi:hypothetical protein